MDPRREKVEATVIACQTLGTDRAGLGKLNSTFRGMSMPEDVGFKKLNVTNKRAAAINASKSNRMQWDRSPRAKQSEGLSNLPRLAGRWLDDLRFTARDGSFKIENLHRGRKLYKRGRHGGVAIKAYRRRPFSVRRNRRWACPAIP